MDLSTYLVFGISIVSIMSAVSTLYVCVRVCIKSMNKYNKCCIYQEISSSNNLRESSDIQYSRNSPKKHIMMIDIVYFMCITYFFHSLQMCLTYIPQIFIDSNKWYYDDKWNGYTCKILAIWAIFTSIQSPLWHILLAYHVCYLLSGYSIQGLDKQKIYHFMFAFGIPSIITIMAIIFNQYGKYNILSNVVDCFLVNSSWRLLQYIFIGLGLIFHYIVIIHACITNNKYKNELSTSYLYQKVVIKNYLRFIIVYSIIWIIPAIFGIFDVLFDSNQLPFWFIFITDVGIASTGIASSIVWVLAYEDIVRKQTTLISTLQMDDTSEWISSFLDETDTNTAP